MGTHWELEWDILGTRKKEKKSLPPPQLKTSKKNKLRHIPDTLSLPIGCMKFLFSKLFLTIFGVG